MLALAVIAAVAIGLAGCGLQTGEANKDLEQAAKHQEEAEVILARLRSFPSEWEAIFNVEAIGADQVNAAANLVTAREQDITALDAALKAWQADLDPILKLNVEDNIKEYVRLKINAIKLYSDYLVNYLQPIIKSYRGLNELIAAGRPISQLNQQAQDILALVTESASKLQECRDAEKRADDFFVENKLGKLATPPSSSPSSAPKK